MAKALGTGIKAGVFWRDMEVVNLPSGRPTLRLTGGALEQLRAITPEGHEDRIGGFFKGGDELAIEEVDGDFVFARVFDAGRAERAPVAHAAVEDPPGVGQGVLGVRHDRALQENAASEQGSRMNAMDNATRNAGDMINRLSIQYNRTRQAAITTELVEIISGAEAL